MFFTGLGAVLKPVLCIYLNGLLTCNFFQEANTQLMLMFEKISTLQSEVDSKEIALDDMTTKYNGSNKSVKSLSDRVREVNLVITF